MIIATQKRVGWNTIICGVEGVEGFVLSTLAGSDTRNPQAQAISNLKALNESREAAGLELIRIGTDPFKGKVRASGKAY